MDKVVLVYTTFPDQSVAEKIVEELVREKFIACGNLLPGMTSIYAWKDAIERGQEVAAVLKTMQSRFGDLRIALKALHPYETPIIIAVSSTAVEQATYDWIRKECA